MTPGIRFVILLLYILYTPYLYSQQPKSNLDDEIKKIGLEYKDKNNFYKAHTYFLERNWDSTLVYSMKQLASEKNKEVIDFCHYFRGYSFKNKKLLQEAIKEFNMVSAGFRFNYKVKLYVGEILLMQNDYKNALATFSEVEKLPTNKTYDFKKGVLLHNLAICYLHLNDYKKAKQYLDKSFVVLHKEKDTISLIGAYMNTGNLYYEQYKDHEAIPYFEQAYLLSKKIKNVELKQNSALNMAIVAENKNNLKAALAYRKEYENWKDSLNDQNKVWAIAQIEKKFSVKEKEKEIHVLVAENRLKIAERNGLFYITVLMVILFGTGIYFYRQKIRSNRIILKQKQELDTLNATKNQLFSIVSHDLRSSVNALKTSNTKLLENLESKNFTELDNLLHNNIAIAHGAYNMLDNLLHWAMLQTKQLYFNKEALHLRSIVEHIEFSYKPLMFDKNIVFTNGVERSVFIDADQGSLKIILRNLMDNAIKFTNAGGSISIYGQDAEPGFYNLIVEDSGSGMTRAVCDELVSESPLLSKKGNNENIGTGLGIQLCKSMALKNGGKLSIESDENKGTKVIIQLQKTKDNE